MLMKEVTRLVANALNEKQFFERSVEIPALSY
jgi:hypothetical protein